MFRSVSMATRFRAFKPSGSSAVPVSFTGATRTGAGTKPLLSTIAMIFSPPLMFVARMPDTIAALFGNGVRAIAMPGVEIRGGVAPPDAACWR
jgi:hypothetical protein